MRTAYTKTARILSSKARPNIPIGLYLIRELPDSGSRNAVSLSSHRATKNFPSPRCASTIQIVRPWNQSLGHSPNSNRLCEKADHRAVYFGIKSHSRQLVRSGRTSRHDLPQETQMNVRRPLIVKKRESGYESVELNRPAPATDSRRPADPTSRMDRAKWRMPGM
jgi:hypothetical protein